MGHTDTLINVLKSGKLERPETLLRDLTQTKEKCARFIYVLFSLFGWNVCFFKHNSNNNNWNKILESFGLSAGPIAFIKLLMRHAYVSGQCGRDVWCCWIV